MGYIGSMDIIKNPAKYKKYLLSMLITLVLFGVGRQEGLAQTYSRGYSEDDDEGTAELIEKIVEYPNDGGLFVKLKKAIVKETNPELRNQGLAVYALGTILRGEMRAGGSARRLLLKKFPDSKYSQALSRERLGRVCEVCDGEGRIERECPVCKGSGKCQMCDGTGTVSRKLTEDEDARCPKCGGTGDCSECDGQRKAYRSCHKCSGRGFVLDKRKVEKCYKSVLQAKPENFLEETSAGKGDPARNDRQSEPEREEGNEKEEEPEKDEDVLRYF